MFPDNLSAEDWKTAKAKAREIVEAAQSLPADLRVEIAEILLLTLPEHYQDEVDHAWQVEIERRVKEIDDGATVLIPGEEVMKMVRQRIRDFSPAERQEESP